MGIDQRRFDVAMAQQFLNGSDACLCRERQTGQGRFRGHAWGKIGIALLWKFFV
jgi:hypothetical protein